MIYTNGEVDNFERAYCENRGRGTSMLEKMISDARKLDDYIQNMHFENEVITDADFSKVEFESVQFVKCQFIKCSFSKDSFYNVVFKNCILSNCIFTESYWRKSKILECKSDGSNFSQSCFKQVTILDSSLCYANCANTAWKESTISNCKFKESFLSEVKFQKLELNAVDFQRGDFFKTSLRGIDLSDCIIDEIMVSETFNELKGVKINAAQAVGIAQRLGMKIV